MKARLSICRFRRALNPRQFVVKSFLLIAVSLASVQLIAQATVPSTAPVVLQEDPFARLDAAELQAARNPIAAAHVERAMQQRPALKLETENTLDAINAAVDEAGNTHVRLQQRYRGLRVIHGGLISHADAKGTFLDYTDSLKRGIQLSTEPKLSQQQALDIVAQHVSHVTAYSWKPKAELVVYPIVQLVNQSTGEPVPHSKKDYRNPHAVPDDLRAEDTAVRVKEYRLAYEVKTVEGGEGVGQPMNAWKHFVDAGSGEVLSSAPLVSTARHTGHGTGADEANVGVSFQTIDFDGGFRMDDAVRKFRVLDDDHSDDDPENRDTNNQWGDGEKFQGDTHASVANRQTAMVDAMFGSRIYWDMMSNVFSRQGVDGDFYSVNVFVHVGTNWDDDRFSYLSGNISVGDGDAPKKGHTHATNRQAVDCLGHENGHGLQHFTASLGGCGIFDTGLGCDTGEPDGLNESDSDIWGAMTKLYLEGGGFASQAHTLPKADPSADVWKSVCSGRDLQRPSARGQSDFWFPGIGDEDPHDAAAPNNRAFYFLAEGASPSMKDESYSPLIPWGMKGIGTQKASKLWFLALTTFFGGDTTYKDAFTACTIAGTLLSPLDTEQIEAVRNAYAGIGVANKPAANYPKLPPAIFADETHSHDSRATATFVSRPTAPKPSGAPDKITIVGSGKNTDFFRVSLKPGESITVRLLSLLTADYDLFLLDGHSTLTKSQQGPTAFDQITFTAPGAGSGAKDFFLKVFPFDVPLGNGMYQLSFDFF